MKHYFVCDRAAWETFPKENFQDSHWIETDDPKKVLIVATFPHEAAHAFWEALQAVEPLPHLLSTGTVRPSHHKMLAGIGVKPGDRTLDVAKKATSVHPLFHPERG